MKCWNCDAVINSNDKFCSSCGEKVIDDGDLRSVSDITIEWIKSSLSRVDYKIEEVSEESFVAVGISPPHLLIWLPEHKKFITFRCRWTITKPGIFKKTDFLSSIIKASASQWICTFYPEEDLSAVNSTAALMITEKMSPRDIRNYAHSFREASMDAIRTANLGEFA